MDANQQAIAENRIKDSFFCLSCGWSKPLHVKKQTTGGRNICEACWETQAKRATAKEQKRRYARNVRNGKNYTTGTPFAI